jgi:probable F420-dependent oxidoreductase
MRFGLALPHYGFSLPGGEPISFAHAAEHARRAEDLGFDSVWISDHLVYSFGRYGAPPDPISALEPLTALAGIAAVTERVRLGSLVLCAPFRHPAILAKMAATIDRLSSGRFDLGIGAGWLREEFDGFGYAFGTMGERFAALEDALTVLRGLFGEGPVTLEAGDVRLEEARLLPRPVQDPHPPIWLGAKGGDRALGLAARLADGWNTVWRWDLEGYAGRAEAAERACEAVGRDPATLRRSVGLYCLIGETPRDVDALLEEGRRGFPGDAMRTETSQTWRRDTLSGTPEEILDRIGAFEDLGVEELIIAPWVLPFAVPRPELLDLFAEQVIAPLRAAT